MISWNRNSTQPGFGSINSKRSRLKNFVINGLKFGPTVWDLFWVAPIRMGSINISFGNKLMGLGLLKSICKIGGERLFVFDFFVVVVVVLRIMFRIPGYFVKFSLKISNV